MKPVDVMHFVSMDVKCHPNYYSHFNYDMYCNTMQQSDPTGDANNEAPSGKICCFLKTTENQDMTRK